MLVKCQIIKSIVRLNVLKQFVRSINTMSGKKYEVVHQPARSRFLIELENSGKSYEAFIDYEHLEPNTIDLYHTEVPVVFRGQGIAQILAEAAFDHVVEENLKMKLSCSYLQKYIRDNPKPEYMERVIQ